MNRRRPVRRGVGLRALGLAILVTSSMWSACSGSDEVTVADLTAEERAELDSLSCGPMMELQPVYFEQMSTELDSLGQQWLLRNVHMLTRCSDIRVRIHGWVNASEDISRPGLPARRAERVYRFYREQGVGDGQVACIVGFGQDPIRIPFETTEGELRDYLEAPRSRRVDTIAVSENTLECQIVGGRQPG